MGGVVVQLVRAAVVALCTSLCLGQINSCFPGEKLEVVSSNFTSYVEDFGLDIFRRFALGTPTKSVFISPYSIWSALTLAYFGSAGNTRRQVEQVLGVNTKTSTFFGWSTLKLLLETDPTGVSGARFRSTNTGYFSDKLRLDNCLGRIITDLRQIDFTKNEIAVNLINSDVNRTTEGRIPKLIDQLPTSTRFALVNAVFFKGLWQYAFSPKFTRKQEFLVPPGVSGGAVDMMVMTNTKFNYGTSATLGAEILELPYRNSSFSMFLFLPSSSTGTVTTTTTILNNLTPRTFKEAYNGLTLEKIDQLILPKFKLTTRLEKELINTLAAMGAKDLFDPHLADLTDFTRTANLFVDKAIHQATVEISEEGTVAAAATALINTRFGGGPERNFICNRPFVFTITDKASAVTLFAGNVVSTTDLKPL